MHRNNRAGFGFTGSLAVCALLGLFGSAAHAAMQPGSLDDKFATYMGKLPDEAWTEGGRRLLDRYREAREELSDVDLSEIADLPPGARQCDVDEAKYRALIGIDIDAEVMFIRQFLASAPANIGVGFENVAVYADGTCPNEIDDGKAVFWVEYHQVMKKKPPEVETDIEAARKQYDQWQGDTMKIQKRLEGTFEGGEPVGVFTEIMHLFPMESLAKQMREQGQDPSHMNVYQYGYLEPDGFDQKNWIVVGEQGASAMSSLIITVQQDVAGEPGGVSMSLSVTDSSYMDNQLVTKQWLRHDEKGRLHGWVHRKGHKQDKLRKACFIRNQPAPPEKCEGL